MMSLQTNMAVLMHRLSTHSRDVNSCCFSSSSKVLASVSGDKTARIWNVDEGNELDFSPLTGHKYQVSTCAFSPFGTILATGSQDCTVILWDANTGAKINVLNGHRGGIRCCAFSPNSNYLASASSDETICIWESSTGKLVRTIKGHECNFYTCRFTPDNLYILSGSSIGDLRLFEVQSGNCTTIVMAHDKGLSGVGVAGCDFSSTFGAADPGNKIMGTGGDCPHFLAASCGGDNTVKLWNVFTASAYSEKCHIQLRHAFDGHQGQVWDCKFSANGKLLASCSSDKNVILWDPLQCVLLYTIEGHTRYVTTVAFSPDGCYLATGSNDRTIQIWKLCLSDTGSLQLSNSTSGLSESGNSSTPKKKLLNALDVNDVCLWLDDLGLGEYRESFRANEVDGTDLATIDHKTLSEDLGVAPLGHRNKILREMKKMKAEQQSGLVPDEYLCPITREIMVDPVIASDGYSYERAAIAGWIESGKVTSPMTNSALSSLTLTPNRSLKNAIMRYFVNSPLAGHA